MAFDGSRFGTGLMAFGAGLAGRDPNVPIQQYQQGIERDERKVNIAALMDNMGIAPNRRALIDMLPQNQQLSWIMGRQDQNQAAAAAAAQYQQEAAAAAQAQADFNAMIAGQGGNVAPQQDAWNAAVSAPLGQGFGGNVNPMAPTSMPVSNRPDVAPMNAGPMGPPQFNASPSGSPMDVPSHITQRNPMGVPVPQQQGVSNLADITAAQQGVQMPPQAMPIAPPQGDIGPMPTGGDPNLGSYENFINYSNMAKDDTLQPGQRAIAAALAQREEQRLGFGGDEGTSSMQEYDMYATQTRSSGGQPMSFMEYQQALKSGDTINVGGPAAYGAIPVGYEVYTNEETGQNAMRPMPGGPAAAAIEQGSQLSAADFADYEANANMVLDIVQGVLGSEGLRGGTGFMQGKLGGYNQPVANFIAKHEQLQGNVFLEAYEKLKGGGPITDYEGDKASNALARLHRTQSEAEYRAALTEFSDIIANGLARARAGQTVGAELSDAELFEKYKFGRP